MQNSRTKRDPILVRNCFGTNVTRVTIPVYVRDEVTVYRIGHTSALRVIPVLASCKYVTKYNTPERYLVRYRCNSTSSFICICLKKKKTKRSSVNSAGGLVSDVTCFQEELFICLFGRLSVYLRVYLCTCLIVFLLRCIIIAQFCDYKLKK